MPQQAEWGLDGNWVDACSLLVAVIYAVYKSMRFKKCKLISKQTGFNVANGAALFPLLMLGLSIFSARLMQELLSANKLILSVAGLVALLSLLEDDF